MIEPTMRMVDRQVRGAYSDAPPLLVDTDPAGDMLAIWFDSNRRHIEPGTTLGITHATGGHSVTLTNAAGDIVMQVLAGDVTIRTYQVVYEEQDTGQAYDEPLPFDAA